MLTLLISMILSFFLSCHLLGALIKRLNNRPMDPKHAQWLLDNGYGYHGNRDSRDDH